MRVIKLVAYSVMLTLVGCASAPVLTVTEKAKHVKVGKSDPTDNFESIGSVTGIDGKSCGKFGYEGTYDRAIKILKNEAANMGGDYVQIFTITEPHISHEMCFDNQYKITGMVFKKRTDTPAPIAVNDVSKTAGIERLRALKLLLDDGIISQDEFDEQKSRILKKGL